MRESTATSNEEEAKGIGAINQNDQIQYANPEDQASNDNVLEVESQLSEIARLKVVIDFYEHVISTSKNTKEIDEFRKLSHGARVRLSEIDENLPIDQGPSRFAAFLRNKLAATFVGISLFSVAAPRLIGDIETKQAKHVKHNGKNPDPHGKVTSVNKTKDIKEEIANSLRLENDNQNIPSEMASRNN